MQVPAEIAGCRILAIAGTEQPESFAGFILDHEIIPNCGDLGIATGPFPEEALGSVAPHDPPANTPPGEMSRRVIRQQGQRLDPLRWCEQTRRPRPLLPPN